MATVSDEIKGRIMIKINSFIHRQVLDDIIRRWMYDEACPADADLITRLVPFNHVYVSRYLPYFSGSSSGSCIGKSSPAVPFRSRAG